MKRVMVTGFAGKCQAATGPCADSHEWSSLRLWELRMAGEEAGFDGAAGKD